MRTGIREDQKLSLKDKSNLHVATKQTVNLSKFSLRKRINVLKNEWWYWDDIIQSQTITNISTDEIEIKKDQTELTKDEENYAEEVLQLFSTNSSDLVHRRRKKKLFLILYYYFRTILFVYQIHLQKIMIHNHI